MIGFRNSLLYTLAGTALNVLMAMLAAFPLSRKNLPGRKIINLFFVFTMFFSGGLVPYFLLVKDTLRLYDTPLALILPGMMSVWYVILIRTYISSSIHEELIESAELDGCPVSGMLIRIIAPLSKPIMAVVALYCAVAIWSGYFEAFIFIRSQNLYPLQVVLRNILILNNVTPDMLGDAKSMAQRQGMKNLLKYSIIVVSSAPLLMMYPFVQKHFVKGIMIGSLKG
jgi:ABC-type glycerol-3-phosphate transport system permease component